VKVLVTGSHGFIGKAVCKELVSRGHEPVGFDSPNDVRDRALVARSLARADGVINLAGVLGTAEMFDAEHSASEVNILGALNVMDAARDLKVPMVQIATGHEGQPNPYAITKKCASDLALARARWKGQEITVVKAYHVYGPGQKMCAPHGKSLVRKIIPSFLARALTRMPIEVNGSGRQMIDLVYLDDTAKVIVDGLFGSYGTVLEAGTGIPSRVIEVATYIAERFGSKVVHLPMRQGEPAETIVCALDPKCPNPWPYKLDETIDWYAHELGVAIAEKAQ
jgi:nucleoside-diphosphate-sugar epimerase